MRSKRRAIGSNSDLKRAPDHDRRFGIVGLAVARPLLATAIMCGLVGSSSIVAADQEARGFGNAARSAGGDADHPPASPGSAVVDSVVLASIPASLDGLARGVLAEERRAHVDQARAPYVLALRQRIDELLPLPGREAPADPAMASGLQARGEYLRRLLVLSRTLESSADPGDRSLALAGAARSAFARLRVEWLGGPLGVLGTIGEARVDAAMGDAAAAQARLETLTADAIDERLRPMFDAARIEVQLMVDPIGALDAAAASVPPIERIVAVAAEQLGRPDEAAAAARRAGQTMDEVERLALLTRVGRASAEERAAWASELVRSGDESRALAVLESDSDRTDAGATLLAVLLERAGRPADAAAVHAIRVEQGNIPQAAYDLARTRVATVVALAGSASDAAVRARARAAALAATTAYLDGLDPPAEPDDAFTEVLGWWIGFADDDAVRRRIDSLPARVRSLPAVAYRHAVARRTTEDPDHLAGELIEIARAAEAEGNTSVSAAAVLLRAQLEPQPRDGLRVLDANQQLLDGVPATRDAARRFRTELRLAMGMLDAAAADLLNAIDAERTPGDGGAAAGARLLRPELLLSVAEGLADRYEEGFRDGIRERATRLATESLDRTAAQPGDAVHEVAVRAATVLARLEAWSDAERALANVSAADAGRVGAQIAWRRGRTDEALAALAADPSAGAAVMRADILLAVDRVPEAIEVARSVRRRVPAGEPLWWNATIQLATAQLRLGDPTSGAAILRAAEALHPTASDRGLTARIDRLRQELRP
ncbi:MAG: hypothetical protein AB8G96_12165 [Phycisphaerales bacterium]